MLKINARSRTTGRILKPIVVSDKVFRAMLEHRMVTIYRAVRVWE